MFIIGVPFIDWGTIQEKTGEPVGRFDGSVRTGMNIKNIDFYMILKLILDILYNIIYYISFVSFLSFV